MSLRISMLFISVLFLSLGMRSQSAVTVKGTVFDTDSTTPMPFVYALNKNALTGTMTDATGHYEVIANLHDTLIFSYLGYEVKRVSVQSLKDSVRNNVIRLKVVLQKKVMNLKEVIIMSPQFTKDEKEYYARKVEEYERFKSQGISSPITGLYMAFSKEGKSLKKLTAMYDNLLYEELLEKRLSDPILRQLTGDENLDCKAFRDYCRVSEDFLTLASQYDLLEAVARKYKDYHSGKKRYNQVKKE